MINISLDTNAVLDLCFRCYPQNIFDTLWEILKSHKSSHQFRFYLCSSTNNEILDQIQNFGYDKTIFESFKEELVSNVIERDDIGGEITKIRSNLAQYSYALSSSYVTKDQVDVDVMATALNLGGQVITCEYGIQGFNWENYQGRPPKLKIPNVCELMEINCTNWVPFFEHLGIRI